MTDVLLRAVEMSDAADRLQSTWQLERPTGPDSFGYCLDAHHGPSSGAAPGGTGTDTGPVGSGGPGKAGGADAGPGGNAPGATGGNCPWPANCPWAAAWPAAPAPGCPPPPP